MISLIVLLFLSVISINIIIINLQRIDKKLNVEISLIFSIAITISIFSFAFFISVIFGIYFYLIILFIAVIYYALKKKLLNTSFKYIPNFSEINYRILSFFIVIVLYLTSIIIDVIKPDGKWDAWAIWNPHAKYLASENWFKLFSMDMGAHTDYPLMLPSIIALNWKLLGSYSVLIPVFISIFVYVLLLFSVIKLSKNYLIGFGIVIALVLDKTFYEMALSQYADTLLALFFLLAITSFIQFKNSNPKLMWVTGFLMASSAWIKNEGFAFVFIFSAISYFFYYRNHKKAFKYFGIGAFFPLLIIILFKLFLAPKNDLVNSNGVAISQLIDLERFKTIVLYIFETILNKYKLIIGLLLIVVLSKKYKIFKSIEFLIIFTMLIAYIFTYMISPYDISWHLSTSADRLIHQLYPSILVIFGSVLFTTKIK